MQLYLNLSLKLLFNKLVKQTDILDDTSHIKPRPLEVYVQPYNKIVKDKWVLLLNNHSEMLMCQQSINTS